MRNSYHKIMKKEIDVRQLRSRLGWTQSGLANYLGVNQATVSRLERGQPVSGPVAKLLALLQQSMQVAE